VPTVIEIPTVLVLGAGASNPLGFPCGEGLFLTVVEGLQDTNKELYRELVGYGFPAEKISEFHQALRKSGANSVDEFLENRTEFLDIGKAAIARVLIPHETDVTLHDRRLVQNTGHWYYHLYEQMRAPFHRFDLNKLQVVTFNYDRSLEQFLITVLQHSHKKPLRECREQLLGIPIIHVYGKLGDLDWEDPPGRPYVPDLRWPTVSAAAQSIRIVHEVGMESEQFSDARTYLDQAERILFLGFGYSPVNLGRLKIDFRRTGRTLAGTAFQLRAAEVERIKGLCPGTKLGRSSWGVLEFLRERVILDARREEHAS